MIFFITAQIGCSEYQMNEKYSTENHGTDTDSPFYENTENEFDTDVSNDVDGEPPTENTTSETEHSYDPDSRYGGITGRICNTSQNGFIIGAEVSIEIVEGDEEHRFVSDITDENGSFTLQDIPFGTYTLDITKGSFYASETVVINSESIQILPEQICLEPDSVNIAVLGGTFDSIEEILGDLDIQYDYYDSMSYPSYITLLQTPSLLESYDIVFFNCGFGSTWLNHQLEINQNLYDYVVGGGSIYVSDWSYYIFESTFPNAINFLGQDHDEYDVRNGMSGTVNSIVHDSNLQHVAGTTVPIHFENSSWAVAESTNATVLIEANVETWNGTQQNTPLAIQYTNGGNAIFTSFHNDEQITETMKNILIEFIYSL